MDLNTGPNYHNTLYIWEVLVIFAELIIIKVGIIVNFAQSNQLQIAATVSQEIVVWRQNSSIFSDPSAAYLHLHQTE